MQEDDKQSETLSPEVQEVMRSLITAMRAVKLYPPNNPIYSQAVKKAHEALARFLETTPEYNVGVLKNFFTYMRTPIGKDTQLNKAIAQDLFTKGVRDITFCAEVTAKEMLDLFQALALSMEEMAMKSGISSILWEKGVSNIKVTEAGLDDVVTVNTGGTWDERDPKAARSRATEPAPQPKAATYTGRTLVLGDLKTDPAAFGAEMVAHAMQTRGKNETVEDRLLTLYQEAGRKIQHGSPEQQELLFAGLAQSALSLEGPYRDALIAGKLYGDMDAENVQERKVELAEDVPNEYHELLTGRFSNEWTVQQVAVLLKRSTNKKISPPVQSPSSPTEVSAPPITAELIAMAREMSEYTAEEMETLKSMSSAGMESDIIDAAVRTQISLIPYVRDPHHPTPDDEEITHFSSVIQQLEDTLSYLLNKKDYDHAFLITKAFHASVDPAFMPRMTEARKKASSKSIITSTIGDLRKYVKGSPEYTAAYTYLSSMDREVTEVLLELLADDSDKASRIALLDLLKEFGKNQLAMLGEYLSDNRWYLVRNIVNVLGESKGDQAIVFLQKAADHKNAKIRQEVAKGLITIGGRKAASILAKFLKDRDEVVQGMAIHGLTEIKGITVEDTKPLIEYLQERSLNKKEHQLTLEAIRALGKVGGPSAGDVLKGFTRVRWWKPRKIQVELRVAAMRAMTEITRRQVDGGPEKR
jgi:HEAT repeat protein